MSLVLFDSLARKKKRFRAPHNRSARIYVCGITPDAPAHIGHAFVFVLFDVLVRYLRHLGHEVTYVQNVTDIDDDVLVRSEKAGEQWRAFGDKHAREFLECMHWLGNAPPDVYPRATDHMQDMIALIKTLIAKKAAYEERGSVYFSVAADPGYGKLSRLSKNAMPKIAQERGGNPDDPNKRDPLDFVLWQKAKPREPSWPSPWSPGRPGWHIECSAMARKYLGKTLDIQGGGADLIFPHHESSRAQSETATGKQYARFWMYGAIIRCKGEKMAKSLGNTIVIGELRKKYSSNAVRIMLLSHHYRKSWEFRQGDMARAGRRNQLIQSVWQAPVAIGPVFPLASWKRRFYAALNDDLNTPKALDVLEDLAKEMRKKNQKKNTARVKEFFSAAFSILGLRMEYL